MILDDFLWNHAVAVVLLVSLLTSPRGITAARPPFCVMRVGARLLGFIDFGDFGDLKHLGCLLEPHGEFIEALEPF